MTGTPHGDQKRNFLCCSCRLILRWPVLTLTKSQSQPIHKDSQKFAHDQGASTDSLRSAKRKRKIELNLLFLQDKTSPTFSQQARKYIRHQSFKTELTPHRSRNRPKLCLLFPPSIMLQESINKHPNIYDIHHLVDSQQFVQTNLVLKRQRSRINIQHDTTESSRP